MSRIELGQIPFQRIVDIDLALLVQLQQGGGRHQDLGQRRQIEEGVLGHRLSGGGGAVQSRFAGQLAGTERVPEHDVSAVSDLDHGAG